MEICELCGASYGRFDGGTEPFTGAKLSVCSPCGEELKRVNNAYKKGDIETCRKLLQELILKTKDPEGSKALQQYSHLLLKGTEQAEQMKHKEAERKEKQEELYKNRHIQYKKNAYYEYCIETVMDSKVSGAFDKEQVQHLLTAYALDGWRLHTAFSNELGKNAAAVLGLGVNTTVEETILIFERCLKGEEK